MRKHKIENLFFPQETHTTVDTSKIEDKLTEVGKSIDKLTEVGKSIDKLTDAQKTVTIPLSEYNDLVAYSRFTEIGKYVYHKILDAVTSNMPPYSHTSHMRNPIILPESICVDLARVSRRYDPLRNSDKLECVIQCDIVDGPTHENYHVDYFKEDF